MGEFLTQLDCSPLKDSDKVWVLKSPLVFRSSILGVITAPTDFHTDLSSVPRLPIIFMLYGGRAHNEGVLHDLLFRKDAADFIEFKEGLKKRVTFFQANLVFFEAMAARGKRAIVKYGMTTGVFLFGWFSFQKRKVMDKLTP